MRVCSVRNEAKKSPERPREELELEAMRAEELQQRNHEAWLARDREYCRRFAQTKSIQLERSEMHRFLASLDDE